MAERIHAYCWPLGRTFTFAEWCAYLREHPGSSEEPVATLGNGWKFNIHGCCINREQAVEVKGAEGDYVRLRLCQEWRDHTGADRTLVWDICADMSVGTWGYCGGCAPDTRLEDRDAAVVAALRWCRARLRDMQERSGEPYTSRYATMLAGIEAELEDKMQLKLF